MSRASLRTSRSRLALVALVVAVAALPALSPPVAADSINVISTGLSPARTSVCAATDGTYAYLFGGYSYPNLYNLVQRYSFDGSFEHAGYLPRAGYELACAWSGTSGYVFGGYANDGTAGLNSIVKFTPGSGASEVGTLESARYGATAVTMGNAIYVIGGRCDGCGGYLDEIVKFDPSTNGDSVVARMPLGRAYARSFTDGTFVYIVGGANGGTYLDTILRFNPATNEFLTMGAKLPGGGRVEPESVYDGAGTAFIFGGYGNGMLDQILRYDVAGDTIVTHALKVPRYQYTAGGVWNRQNAAAYLFGGYNQDFTALGDVTKFGETPGRPTSPSASRGPLAGQISLAWTRPAGIEPSGYHVYRGTSAGQAQSLAGTVTAAEFTDTGLTAGTRYYYVVKAFNGNGDGEASAEVSAKAPESPNAPASISASTGSSLGRIEVSWPAPTDTGGIALSGYRVYRGSSPGAVDLSQPVASPTGTSLSDAGLPNGALRCYRVVAVNGVGPSAASTEACANAPDFPDAPGALATARGPRAGQVTLDWDPPASTGHVAILSYKVYRSVTPGGGVESGFPVTVTAGTAWTDSGLARGAVRYYRVSAVNLVGEGSKGAEARGQAPDLPGVPTSFSASPDPANVLAIRLSWAPPVDTGGIPLDGFRIFRSTVAGGTEHVIDIGTASSYSDSQRLPGVRYYYRIAAENDVGLGLASARVSSRPHTLSPGVDSDGDLVANAVESRLCSTPGTSGLIDDLGYLGRCESAADWEAMEFVDADNDWVPNVVEPTLCDFTDPNDPTDGICVDQDGDGQFDDWGLPQGA